MSSAPAIVITSLDYDRIQGVLQPLLQAAPSENVELLDEELARATIVSPEELAPNVVSMNSEFIYEDLGKAERRRARLVYPHDANVDRSWISVLAPLGSALLGMETGKEIHWSMPNGGRRLKLVEICYQPEAAGDWSL
jgi:regulator of nucleoside diphosphate kinase